MIFPGSRRPARSRRCRGRGRRRSRQRVAAGAAARRRRGSRARRARRPRRVAACVPFSRPDRRQPHRGMLHRTVTTDEATTLSGAGHAQRFGEVVDGVGEGGDVVGLDGREHRDAQLVAAELAVGLGVDDAVGAQRGGDGGGVDVVDEVDGAAHVAALRRLGHERLGERARLRPAVEELGGPVAAADGELEPALVEHPAHAVRRAGTATRARACCRSGRGGSSRARSAG